jgi:hypothetical protein
MPARFSLTVARGTPYYAAWHDGVPRRKRFVMADEEQGFTPPYFPFSALLSLLARIRELPPSRIDRGYLSWLPGITQTYLMSFLKAVGYIDENRRMTDPMKALVAADAAEEKRLIGELVRSLYKDAFALGTNATQNELEELFRDRYGVRGSTQRKAISFFLKAAEHGGVEVSPLFKTPRATSSSGTPRKPRKGKSNSDDKIKVKVEEKTERTPPSDMDTLRARYVEMLMTKAQEEGDADLLDRIERLLGYEEVSE